jgi:Spy/CpxP family protein refolding chaperone
MKPRAVIATLCLGLAAGPVSATEAAGPYAGQQARAVTSLSAEDVAELMAGRGWGLAKPAEVNGYPGPRHVLDLARELALDDRQTAAVEAIFGKMQTTARETGRAYVAAEHALDAAFRSGRVDAALLADRLAAAGRLRDRLREIHLAAHLETASLLSEHQRRLYQELRGYDSGGGHGHGAGRDGARHRGGH